MRSKRYRREAMAKRVALLGVALVVLAACGTSYRPGDEHKTCNNLESEIAANEARIAALQPDENASGEEEALRPRGTLAFMPFALTRPEDGPAIQARSLHRRNAILSDYAANKGC